MTVAGPLHLIVRLSDLVHPYLLPNFIQASELRVELLNSNSTQSFALSRTRRTNLCRLKPPRIARRESINRLQHPGFEHKALLPLVRTIRRPCQCILELEGFRVRIRILLKYNSTGSRHPTGIAQFKRHDCIAQAICCKSSSNLRWTAISSRSDACGRHGFEA